MLHHQYCDGQCGCIRWCRLNRQKEFPLRESGISDSGKFSSCRKDLPTALRNACVISAMAYPRHKRLAGSATSYPVFCRFQTMALSARRPSGVIAHVCRSRSSRQIGCLLSAESGSMSASFAMRVVNLRTRHLGPVLNVAVNQVFRAHALTVYRSVGQHFEHNEVLTSVKRSEAPGRRTRESLGMGGLRSCRHRVRWGKLRQN